MVSEEDMEPRTHSDRQFDLDHATIAKRAEGRRWLDRWQAARLLGAIASVARLATVPL